MQMRVIPTGFAVLILLFMAFYILALLPAIPAPDLSHAISKHGVAAVEAAKCIEDPRSYIFYNKQTNRIGYALCRPDGRWAVAFTENGRKVTAFFKEKLKRLDQIIRYMENTGYVQ